MFIFTSELGWGNAVKFFKGAGKVATVGKTAFFHNFANRQGSFCKKFFCIGNSAKKKIIHNRKTCYFFKHMAKGRNADAKFFCQCRQIVMHMVFGFKAVLKFRGNLKIFFIKKVKFFWNLAKKQK